jgi:hypothetical protein
LLIPGAIDHHAPGNAIPLNIYKHERDYQKAILLLDNDSVQPGCVRTG